MRPLPALEDFEVLKRIYLFWEDFGEGFKPRCEGDRRAALRLESAGWISQAGYDYGPSPSPGPYYEPTDK